MAADKFDRYFQRTERLAVLLHRPYPPQKGKGVNSKFGGLPNLPLHFEWPRNEAGNALHFLAQIDCAEIPFDTALPKRGTLFFFAHENEEQLWDFPKREGNSRVLYVADAIAAAPARQHPADLEPIGGGGYQSGAWYDILSRGDNIPTVHIEWPIIPLPIATWPDAYYPGVENRAMGWFTGFFETMFRRKPRPSWDEVEATQKEYRRLLEQRKRLAYSEATRIKLDEASRPILGHYIAADQILDHADIGDDAYPQHWLTVFYASKAMCTRFRADRHDAPDLITAQKWANLAEGHEADRVVLDQQRAEFRKWLLQLEEDTRREIIFRSAVATIRSWAGQPEKADLIAPYVYDYLRYYLETDYAFGLKYSQMLGHAPSVQDPLDPTDPTLCLLNLASDNGPGWSFGDVGNGVFLIQPDELDQHRFSDVIAQVAGH